MDIQDNYAPHRRTLFSNRQLWTLVWPLLIEQLLQITVGIADILMVATLGEETVSAVSLVDQINLLLTQLFGALATGGAVVCSQFLGAQAVERAKSSAVQLLHTCLAISLAIMVFGLLTHLPLLSSIFGAVSSGVMAVSDKYFLITICGLPFVALYNAASALFRAQGNSRISMHASLITNFLNIGGNALLIFGFGCGVEGVAIPTVVSRFVGALFLLLTLIKSRSSLLEADKLFHFRPDWRLIGKILSIGIPSGIENSMFQVGKILVLSLISTYGTAAVAANAAANTLASFQVLPGVSIGLAMLTVVGQCIGAGQPDEAVRYVRKLMTVCYVGMILLNVPLWLLTPSIIGLYNLSEETAYIAFIMASTHAFCGVVIWPVAFALPNSLRAAGDARFTMLVSIASVWIVRVGMSHILTATNGFGIGDWLLWSGAIVAEWTWVAMILDWIVRTVFFIARFHRGGWRGKSLVN